MFDACTCYDRGLLFSWMLPHHIVIAKSCIRLFVGFPLRKANEDLVIFFTFPPVSNYVETLICNL